MLQSIIDRLVREPVVLRNLVSGAVLILTVFGISVPDATQNTIIDMAGIVLSVLISMSARSKVTPV